MKLCIPVATPDGLAAALEADFGAAQHLLILDSDSDTPHAIDRAQPELIREEVVSGIQGILCGAIHPRLLFELQQNGIQVFGCEAATAGEALAQFRAGTLEAAPPFALPPEMQGGCGCGGHAEAGHGCGCGDAEGEGCCGGHGEDHECCGGKGHDDPDHECCGGKGEGHGCGCGH